MIASEVLTSFPLTILVTGYDLKIAIVIQYKSDEEVLYTEVDLFRLSA